MNPLDILPQDRRSAVDTALASVFPGAAVQALTPMAGGASGAGVYRLDIAGRSVVLRLDLPAGGFNDPARHYACHRIAAHAGVAPALLYANPDDRVAISAFVEKAPSKAPLPAIAKAVRRLHDTPLFPTVAPYLAAMESVVGYLDASGAVPEAPMKAAHALLAAVAQVYPSDPADFVSTHADTNPGNIVFDGERVLLIDWAAGFAADRYVDLSSVLNFFTTDAEGEALVLRHYFGREPTALEDAKLRAMRPVNRLFYGAVMIATVAQQRPGLRIAMEDIDTPNFAQIRQSLGPVATPDGMVKMGCVFLGEALRAPQDPAFVAALKHLRA